MHLCRSIVSCATGKSGMGHIRRITNIAQALARLEPATFVEPVVNASPRGNSEFELTQTTSPALLAAVLWSFHDQDKRSQIGEVVSGRERTCKLGTGARAVQRAHALFRGHHYPACNARGRRWQPCRHAMARGEACAGTRCCQGRAIQIFGWLDTIGPGKSQPHQVRFAAGCRTPNSNESQRKAGLQRRGHRRRFERRKQPIGSHERY
jgi:hypothetical protein